MPELTECQKVFDYPAALQIWFSQTCKCSPDKSNWCGILNIDTGVITAQKYTTCCQEQKHHLTADILCNRRILCLTCYRLVTTSRVEDMELAKTNKAIGQQPYDWIHNKLMEVVTNCWQEKIRQLEAR